MPASKMPQWHRGVTRLGHPTLGLFMTEAHINPVLESTNSVTPCFCNGPSNPSAEATTLQ